jgi:hypothetical protein
VHNGAEQHDVRRRARRRLHGRPRGRQRSCRWRRDGGTPARREQGPLARSRQSLERPRRQRIDQKRVGRERQNCRRLCNFIESAVCVRDGGLQM